MNRYRLILVVRDMFHPEWGEKPVEHRTTQASPVDARHDALERAYDNGLFVSRFQSIEVKALPHQGDAYDS